VLAMCVFLHVHWCLFLQWCYKGVSRM
jgi:hypothetical protein